MRLSPRYSPHAERPTPHALPSHRGTDDPSTFVARTDHPCAHIRTKRDGGSSPPPASGRRDRVEADVPCGRRAGPAVPPLWTPRVARTYPSLHVAPRRDTLSPTASSLSLVVAPLSTLHHRRHRHGIHAPPLLPPHTLTHARRGVYTSVDNHLT